MHHGLGYRQLLRKCELLWVALGRFELQADSDQEDHNEIDEETPLRSLSAGASTEPNRCGTWHSRISQFEHGWKKSRI